MVEYTSRIDDIFASLADPVRRDILERVYVAELTVNQIAMEYDISLAAISKHIKILFEAGLVRKRKKGRYQLVSAEPQVMSEAMEYFKKFEDVWSQHADEPDGYLKRQ
jgi:DNA-binding transcriptional ArsR family regulator